MGWCICVLVLVGGGEDGEGCKGVRTDIDSESHDVISRAFDVSDYVRGMSLPCQRTQIEDTIYVWQSV